MSDTDRRQPGMGALERGMIGLSRAQTPVMALCVHFVNNARFVPTPITAPQMAMESAMRGSKPAYTPGMNGAWLEDR